MTKVFNNYNKLKISGNIEQELCGEDILAEAERYKLLVEWNKTQSNYPIDKSNYPIDKCINQLFEATIERPNAVAALFEGEQLTYRELNAKANQLAHYLRSLGVKPEVLVGICAERSLEMVVGLLGILKSGGAYVPLDPTYPRESLAFMLEDSSMPILGTAIVKAESTSILIDLTKSQENPRMSYDINKEWDWGGGDWTQTFPPSTNLTEMLIADTSPDFNPGILELSH